MKDLTNNEMLMLPNGYSVWRKDIEQLIESAKLHTAISVNTNMLSLYWTIGRSILQKQQEDGWGKKVIEQLSKDLSKTFPDDRGYSERNLRNMKRFAEEYPHFPILQVPLAKLEGQPIWQVALAKLKEEGKDFVQVPEAALLCSYRTEGRGV